MRDVAEFPSNRLAESLRLDLSNFDKYKPLMRKNISQRIKDLYDLPDSHWDSYMLCYIKREREKLEDFMGQLEQKLPFSALDPTLQAWIEKTSNWYRVPPQVKIKVADELDPKEHHIQHAARELLFDAVAGRSFSREYPSLVPHLFLHWKDELLERMEVSRAEAVRAIERLAEIPDELQGEVLCLLDQTVGEVHPELKAVWQPEIVKQFQEFMKPQREPLEDRKKKTAQKIKGLGKNLSDLAKSHSDVSAKIEEVKKALREAEGERLDVEQRMRELPTAASELTRDQYDQFRVYFFQKRDVSQCVERLFAKVLGHDRFFSVFISNKPGIAPLHNQAGSRLQLGNRMPYDVIAPCDKNCQHHALGHLYVGDMLCHQSVDHLDYIRQIHGLEGVTDRFIRLGL